MKTLLVPPPLFFSAFILLSGTAAFPQDLDPQPDLTAPDEVGEDVGGPAVPLSFWANEIAKLVRAGVGDAVTLAFLDNVGTVNLGAEQIICLRDMGASAEVITAMLQHDLEIDYGVRPLPSFSMPMVESLAIRFSSNAAPAMPEKRAQGLVNNGSLEMGTKEIPAETRRAFEETDMHYAFDEAAPVSPPHKQPRFVGVSGSYAVREPYPVPLAEPIIMFKAEVRTPNIVSLEPFP